MPYKKIIVGIYTITTPNGSIYVGSSNNIYRRWSEHRRSLRKKCHHSTRLQAAWEKYGDFLRFEIVKECELHEIESLEQQYITSCGAELNTTQYVNNVWCNPQTRARLEIIHSSEKWKKDRSAIAKRVVASRRKAVECDDGRVFKSFCHAAKVIGVTPSQIKQWCNSQRPSQKYGVRFKLAEECWREVLSVRDQMMATRIKNGTLFHTEPAKEKMRVAKIGFVPAIKGKHHTDQAKQKMAASQKRVEIIDSHSNKIYQSCVEAAKKTGISRTHIRRLLARNERFQLIARIESINNRNIK